MGIGGNVPGVRVLVTVNDAGRGRFAFLTEGGGVGAFDVRKFDVDIFDLGNDIGVSCLGLSLRACFGRGVAMDLDGSGASPRPSGLELSMLGSASSIKRWYTDSADAASLAASTNKHVLVQFSFISTERYSSAHIPASVM